MRSKIPHQEPPRILVKSRPTKQADDSLNRILEGGQADEIINQLDPESRDLFYGLVDELKQSSDKSGDILEQLWRIDYVKTPPTIAEFLDDPYWLGDVTCPTEDNQGIFPIWRKVLTEDFDLDSKVHNVVVTGSLGIGKCHRAGDMVRLYNGLAKPVEQVKPGDKLVGDDWQPRNVISTAKGRGQLYTIRPVYYGWSNPLHVNGEHVLCLKHRQTRNIVEVSVNDVLKACDDFKSVYGLYRNDGSDPVCFTIDPENVDDYYGFVIDGNHRYIMADGVVTHNTWLSTILILYRIALAKLLRNPQNFFGMSRGAMIYYTLLSVTREQVGTTAFADALNFMGHSPFFVEECGFNPDKMYADQLIQLGNSIAINGGSKGWHFIGKNVMGILFDEGNFRLENNPNLKAYQLFNEARQRFKSRFQKKRGFLPAISILSSSAADESSFTESVIKEIVTAGDPNQRVYRSSVYKAREHMLEGLDTDRWFKVSHGLRNIEPVILNGWYSKDGKSLDPEPGEAPMAGCSVELVPERYMPEFRRDCRGSLQAISGISAGGTHRLFPSTIDIEVCIELAEKDGLVNPCKIDRLPLSMEDDRNIWDYLEHTAFLMLSRSIVIPKRHADMLRFAHVDLATENLAGVSICHLIGRAPVHDQKLGVPYSEYRLVVEYDFILTIMAGQRKPISIGKIFNFFFWLRDKCNFKFGLVTADQWQASMPLETLETAGFKVGHVSLDRTSTPYHEWRRGFSEHRIRLFRQQQMISEAENLLDFGAKVEKPIDGSKDTTDSAAGAYWNAISQAAEGVVATHVVAPSLYQDSTIAPQTSEAAPISFNVGRPAPPPTKVHVI